VIDLFTIYIAGIILFGGIGIGVEYGFKNPRWGEVAIIAVAWPIFIGFAAVKWAVNNHRA